MVGARRPLVAFASALALAGCASRTPARTDPAVDRERDAAAVYDAVLGDLRSPDTRLFVSRRSGTRGRGTARRSPAASPVRGATRSTTTPRAPSGARCRDPRAGAPRRVVREADWKALPLASSDPNQETEGRWTAFRGRFPGAAGWILFSDVGFSRDGRRPCSTSGRASPPSRGPGTSSSCGATASGWRVAARAMTAIA